MKRYKLVNAKGNTINSVIALGYETTGIIGRLCSFHTMQSAAMHYRSFGEKVFVKPA